MERGWLNGDGRLETCPFHHKKQETGGNLVREKFIVSCNR